MKFLEALATLDHETEHRAIRRKSWTGFVYLNPDGDGLLWDSTTRNHPAEFGDRDDQINYADLNAEDWETV